MGGRQLDLGALPRDRELSLRASWPSASREAYLRHDSESARLVERVESLRLSWFVTAGELAYDHTGREPSEREAWSENAWHTPAAAGGIHLWLVLRDDRRGSAYVGYDLDVL